jgi:hypothetical protein
MKQESSNETASLNKSLNINSSFSLLSTTLDNLSDDLIEYISISFLTCKDINNWSLCNSKFYHVLNSVSCWLELCKRDFNPDYLPIIELKQPLKQEEQQDYTTSFLSGISNEVSDSNDAEKDAILSPRTKTIYRTLRDQWKFETQIHSDLSVSEDRSTVWRDGSTTRNPVCICEQPFIIYEQTNSDRTFGYRSYCELRMEPCEMNQYWICVGAAANNISRHGNLVLGNTSNATSIGYYGASVAPTINLNGQLLNTPPHLQTLVPGDIVGVHVYR